MENLKPGNAVENGQKLINMQMVTVDAVGPGSPATSSSPIVSQPAVPEFRHPNPPSTSDKPSLVRCGVSAVELSGAFPKERESFGLAPRHRSNSAKEKTRSMTEVDIAADHLTQLQLIEMNQRLRIEDPPKSLVEARQAARDRDASNKAERKANIDFIRQRTASRAAHLGLTLPIAAPFRPEAETLIQNPINQVPKENSSDAMDCK